jgi:integrase
VPPKRLSEAIGLTFQELQPFWNAVWADGLTYYQLQALKSFLHFLCATGIGAWRTEWADLLSAFPLRTKDKYASVRTGDAFLDADEEAALVREIDKASHLVREREYTYGYDELLEICILVCSYQFLMRPKQIAMLQVGQIRVWDETEDDLPAVHLTFTKIKQRASERGSLMVRKVHREWGSLFVELLSQARSRGLVGTDKIFGLNPYDLGQNLLETTKRILGEPRSANELRHSGAQRLADAGASLEEVATNMGHTDQNTSLIYYRASPSQAERVNRALAISPVYQRVVQIAHNRFISTEELLTLKGDQQIGGVPHGIPITGIGGCSSGQPACPYNPVLSCYGCRKFMPVSNPEIHNQVLADFRGVVRSFEQASRGESSSPAFMQLRRTLDSIEAIVEELEAERGES